MMTNLVERFYRNITLEQSSIFTFNTALLLREDQLDALRENFSVVGPVSIMVGPEVPDPIEFSTRVYHHYLGDLTFDLDRMEDLTRVIKLFFFLCS